MSFLPVPRGIKRGYQNLEIASHNQRVNQTSYQPFKQLKMKNPYRSFVRFRRSKKGRRRYRRRRIRRISSMWPRFKLVKFRVVTTFGSSPGAGAGTTIHNYKANSLDDPHGGAGSNLPLGLDQWSAMYKKYVVVKSTHYAKVHNTTSTGSVTFGISLRAPEESNNLASAEYYQEIPMTRSKLLSPDLDHAALGITYKAKKYWGVKKFMDHEELHGDLSTTPVSPIKMAYVQLWHADTNNTEAYTLEGWITSEYTCLLFEPVTPSRSSL